MRFINIKKRDFCGEQYQLVVGLMILLFYNIRESLKFDFLMSPTYIHIVYFIMSFTFCF